MSRPLLLFGRVFFLHSVLCFNVARVHIFNDDILVQAQYLSNTF